MIEIIFTRPLTIYVYAYVYINIFNYYIFIILQYTICIHIYSRWLGMLSDKADKEKSAAIFHWWRVAGDGQRVTDYNIFIRNVIKYIPLF